jgi:hypothetical protein
VPTQRFGLHFTDEAPGDVALWREWIARLPPSVKSVAEMGQTRPLIEVATPFKASGEATTKRSDEVTGLAVARSLVDALVVLAGSTGRSIEVMLAGRRIGRVERSGANAALDAKLDEWQTLVNARPPDEPEWEREGFLSIWAGTLPYTDVEKLLAERYGTDGPISAFARALQVGFYDHDFIEHTAEDEPVELRALVGQLSFSKSYVELLPDEVARSQVNTVIVLFDTDFSKRPRNVARGRLRFVGAFPYDGASPAAVTKPPRRRGR